MIRAFDVQCPACWEAVALEIDVSEGAAEFYEDCPVCCQPMRVQLRETDDGDFAVAISPGND